MRSMTQLSITNDAPSLRDTSLEDVQRRQRRLLNGWLLAIGLLLVVVAGVRVGLQISSSPLISLDLQDMLLAVGLVCVIIAAVLNRYHRRQIASSVLIALVVAALAGINYFYPPYTLALLPLMALPVGLAALLLDRRAIFLTAACTIFALASTEGVDTHTTGLFQGLFTFPWNDLAKIEWAKLPIDLMVTIASIVIALFASLLLALILAPLREENAHLLAIIQQSEAAKSQVHRDRHLADQSREQAEARLLQQQHYIDHIDQTLQHIDQGVIAIDAAGAIVRANEPAERLWTELAGERILGKTLDQVRTFLEDAHIAPLGVTITKLADSPSDITGYTHVLSDRREYAHLARLRGELLALLTDEMRNPLTSIVTALEITLGQSLPDGVDRVIAGARRSGQQLIDLVTILLEINQIEQNPSALRREHTTVRPILEAAIAQTAPFAQQRAVVVVVEYSGDGPLLVDSERLRRAFVIILEEALRNSPSYSTMQIRTERQPTSIVVRVSDQGPELPPAQRVTPEQRSVPTLGLVFSKLVLEAHGGRLWVESAGGHGNVHVFSLPIEQSKF